MGRAVYEFYGKTLASFPQTMENEMKGNHTGAGNLRALRNRAEALRQTRKKTRQTRGSNPRPLPELISELEALRNELDLRDEELRKSRLKLETAREDLFNLYEMSPVGYLVLDRNGAITRSNPAFPKLINKERHQLTNAVFAELILREDRNHFNAVLHKVMTSNEKSICEVKLAVASDLPPLDAHLEIIASRDCQSGLLDLFVAVVDISQRKQAEFLIKQAYDRLEEMVRERTESLRQVNQRLKESEEKFRTVADFNYDWEYWIGPDGAYRYISPSCQNISGYPPERFMADQEFLLTITHSEDRDKVTAHFRRALESREVKHIEFRIVNPEANVRWISHSCQPVYDSDGNYSGRRASNRDISSRKEMEEELASQERQLRLALDASSDGVWDRNLQTGAVFYGENWRRGLGYDAAEEFVYEKLVHRDDLTKVLEARQAHLSGESKRYEVEFRIRAKNGEWRWMLSRGRVVEWDSAGLPSRLVGTHTDITRFKEVEFELAQAQAGLEKRVAARTLELEETNIALRVLLKKRAQDKTLFERQILANVRGLVEPYLDKLEATGLEPQQETLVAILKSNLREICSPFAQTLSAKFLKLTPSEVTIANLVKIGKSTKEVAGLMNLSPGTINIHRKNIRRKLGLTNQKSNLQTILSQFTQEMD